MVSKVEMPNGHDEIMMLIHGGSWQDDQNNALVNSWRLTNGDTRYIDIGFRVIIGSDDI